MDSGRNHFELFGLPVAFEVDMTRLAETYRELQRALHPDRFANASDRERRLSVQQAARVNEAYQILRSPLRRARYLLELRGVEFDEPPGSGCRNSSSSNACNRKPRKSRKACWTDPRPRMMDNPVPGR